VSQGYQENQVEGVFQDSREQKEIAVNQVSMDQKDIPADEDYLVLQVNLELMVYQV